MSLPSRPRARRLVDGLGQPFDRQRVFGADIDEADCRADGVAADRHAFDHQVGVAFEQAAVHESARVAFVGVADDVLLVAAATCGPAPI